MFSTCSNFHAGIETKRNLVNNTYSREFNDKQKQTKNKKQMKQAETKAKHQKQ